MAQDFFSLITTIGRNKLATAVATNDNLVIAEFVIGDGNGITPDPTPETTELVNEVYRTGVESVLIDPNNPSAILVSAIIPTTEGGWWMREFGIIDDEGAMIAVAKPVAQYKPTAEQGQLEDIRYEFQIIVGETANVIMQVEPSALYATREWVINRALPFVQLQTPAYVPVLSVALTEPPALPSLGDLYVVAANPAGDWAGKAQQIAEWDSVAWDFVDTPNGHVVGTPDGGQWIKKAGAYVLQQERPFASAEETIAGEDADKPTNSVGVKAAIDAAIGGLPEDQVLGLATPEETIAGENTTKATHAAGVKAAIDGAIAGIIGLAPDDLDDFAEIAAAITANAAGIAALTKPKRARRAYLGGR